MGLIRITSDQRLAPLLGLGIALIAGATLVAYAVVGSEVGTSLRDSRSLEQRTRARHGCSSHRPPADHSSGA